MSANAGSERSGAPPLRVLIVDDEEPARWRMRTLVEECPAPLCVVAGEADNAARAVEWLAHHPCDLVLLDIAMPGRDGVSLAAEIRRQGAAAPALIFVTAHAEHALKAFELAASDYLTKPVRRERLHSAMQRVADQLALRRRLEPAAVPDAAAVDEPPVLVIVDRARVMRVPVADVLYLKAELKYVTVRTARQSLIHDRSLAELEARLGGGFIRIHRNALVARDAVRALERRVTADGDEDGGESWAVQIAEVDEWLAVSRRQVQAVREALLSAGR